MLTSINPDPNLNHLPSLPNKSLGNKFSFNLKSSPFSLDKFDIKITINHPYPKYFLPSPIFKKLNILPNLMGLSKLMQHLLTRDLSVSTIKIEWLSSSISQNLSIAFSGRKQLILEYLMAMEVLTVRISSEIIYICSSPDKKRTCNFK